MKKTFKIEDLDCANCAAKLEKAVSSIDGVTKATVSFIAQKMIIEADEKDFDAIIKALPKTAKKAVPDCTIIL